MVALIQILALVVNLTEAPSTVTPDKKTMGINISLYLAQVP